VCALSAQQTRSTAAAKVSAKDQVKIRQALSAAPADVGKGAGVMDWPAKEGGPMRMLRSGTNGWMCMPSSPGKTTGALQDPMCLDKAWMGWADAYMSKKDPPKGAAGIGYMLRGDKGVSNTDPFATSPTADNQWIVGPPHVMVLLPDPSQLDAFPTDPNTGGPWVMWKGTKYAHLMVPIAAIPKKAPAKVKR
jgi:hypothetical protein